ncbi:MarR family winged helix-turn-helix transcriptional regulator [Amycolatopsis sp. GA6-003]|uniref:MarR family winged helix-turn-helix transcriptional regulator n=1 Tax=Amycolatopsis sp. GA6-003 TaxID=2652444 RepID=UPI0039174360
MSQDKPAHADAQRIASAIGTLLLRANRMHLYDTLLEGHTGIDRWTYPVLSGLARIGPSSASELADQIGLDRTVTTRYASRLQAAGLLTRQPSPHDLRATVLQLTAEGERCIQTLRARLNDLVLEALPGWSPSRIHAFAQDFDQVVQNLVGTPAAGDDEPAET